MCNAVSMRPEPEFRRRPEGRRGPRPRGDNAFFIAERRGRSQTSEQDRAEIRAWFLGNLVDNWFTGTAKIDIDDHEILVVGELSVADIPAGEMAATAEAARIERFRNDTRDRRMEIATRAEEQFSRKVSWGAHAGSTTRRFTTASVPVMTRLQMVQRRTLDTLVDAGVARSRSEALAWCVELVGQNEQPWIGKLREALKAVEEARGEGPGSDR